MRFNDRVKALLDIPDLPDDAFQHVGNRKIRLHGGGGGGIPIISPVVNAVVNVGKAVVKAVVNVVSTVVNFATSIVSSLIVSKPKIPDMGNQGIDASTAAASSITGSRQQIAPASSNKLPVLYGSAYMGGTIIDLSITSNNQTMYYVLAICEVTNTENSAFGDTFTFGNIYYGGKRCVFDGSDATKVIKLIDESTGAEDVTINGKLFIYTYRNGSYNPTNTSLNAIQVMSDANLVYKWDSSKLMSNCVFAIVKLNYNSEAGVTSLQQTKFQVTNNRTAVGDCFIDYLKSSRYGAAIPASQINTASFDELNAYSNQQMTYTTFNNTTSTLRRFQFDGVLDTSKSIQSNMQIMADCCDCLIRYNEITAKWGVVVQKPTYTSVMDISDDNIVSAIRITPIDSSASYNIIEVYYAENANQDAFNSVTFDLATIAPSLLYNNEPINKQTVTLSLVNNNVRAQYLATRFLEGAREDLQVTLSIMFVGIQLEAGDIVSVTVAKYGWNAKLFRVVQVVENFNADGTIVVDLNLMEYNPQVYDDKNITQFSPAPNSGLGSATAFGTVPAPVVSNFLPTVINPSFDVAVTTSSAGIIQYAEIWYSAFATPTDAQRIFAGTTAIQSSGTPYDPNTLLPTVTITGIPAGNWYFFSRMVNSLATSQFSPASTLISWRPMTFQFAERYLNVAFADNATGGGFSFDQTNKTYFGLANTNTPSLDTNPVNYTWYPANPVFGTDKFLLYINRGSRRFSFASGTAGYASATGAFVPTDTSVYDPTQWSGLPTDVSFIDLDYRTGQLLSIGTSSVSASDGLLRVTNTSDGTVIAALQRFLNFGAGVYTKTFSASVLTVDIYGRVVGVTQPDDFYFTHIYYNATAGQTTFAVTHIVGQVLVFKNGILLDTSEYSETTANITLGTAASLNDRIVIINMRVTAYENFYYPLNITVSSVSGNDVYYQTATSPYQDIKAGDLLTFANTGTPTTYTVSAVNYTTRKITFTTAPSATAGNIIYNYVAANQNYRPFTRYTADVTNVSSYSPTTWEIDNGNELPFFNGVITNEADYDISSNVATGFPAALSGRITWIQFANNNLGISCASCQNSLFYSTNGQTTYSFDNNPNAFQLYMNGVILSLTEDYSATSSDYTLVNAPSNDYTLIQQQIFARVGAA